MSQIADRLKREFQKAVRSKIVSFAALAKGKANAESIPPIDQMVRDGTHPAHAVYKHTVNLISVFVEQVVPLPFLRDAYKFLTRAEDLYSPGYPPMSPITLTYYNSWTFFDVGFGRERETLGGCFLAAADCLRLDPLQVEATRNLCQSSLGIFQAVRVNGNLFSLRELVTGREIEAFIPTGFKTRTGSLVLLRVLPPLAGLATPHIGFTTPYVLAGNSEADWLEYLRRQQIIPGTVGVEERLRRHMKNGKADWPWSEFYYWSEFVFYAYVNHRSDAIFLAGFPDRPETQPHHKSYDERTVTMRLVQDMKEALALGR